MQLSTFLSDSRIEQPFGEEIIVGETALKARASLIRAGDRFDCLKCNWKSSSGSHGAALPKDDVPPQCSDANNALGEKASLHSLNDDVLSILISHLDTPSLLVFAKIYRKVANLVKETNVRRLFPDRTPSFII